MDIFKISKGIKYESLISTIGSIQKLLSVGKKLADSYQRICADVYRAYLKVCEIHGNDTLLDTCIDFDARELELIRGKFSSSVRRQKQEIEALELRRNKDRNHKDDYFNEYCHVNVDAETKKLIRCLTVALKFRSLIEYYDVLGLLNLKDIETEFNVFLRQYDSTQWDTFPLEKQAALMGLFSSFKEFINQNSALLNQKMRLEELFQSIDKLPRYLESTGGLFIMPVDKYVYELCQVLKSQYIKDISMKDSGLESETLDTQKEIQSYKEWSLIPGLVMAYQPKSRIKTCSLSKEVSYEFHMKTIPENTSSEISVLFRNTRYICSIQKMQKKMNVVSDIVFEMDNKLKQIIDSQFDWEVGISDSTILIYLTPYHQTFIMELIPNISLSLLSLPVLRFIFQASQEKNKKYLVPLTPAYMNPSETCRLKDENTLILSGSAFTSQSSYLAIPKDIVSTYFRKKLNPMKDTSWDLTFSIHMECYTVTLGYQVNNDFAYLNFGLNEPEQHLLSYLRMISAKSEENNTGSLYLLRTEDPNKYLISFCEPSVSEKRVPSFGEKETDAISIYRYLCSLPRYSVETVWQNADIEGLYFLFEPGEQFGTYDRIVAIGMNSEHQSMKSRIRYLFFMNKNLHELRREIGTSLLYYNRDPYASVWISDKYVGVGKGTTCLKKEEMIEEQISAYLNKCTIAFFPVSNIGVRRELYMFLTSMFTSLYAKMPSVSSTWEGQYHPNPNVRNGLWNASSIPMQPIEKVTGGLKTLIRSKMGVMLHIPTLNSSPEVKQKLERVLSSAEIKECMSLSQYSDNIKFSYPMYDKMFNVRNFALITDTLFLIDIAINRIRKNLEILLPSCFYSFFYRDSEQNNQDCIVLNLIYQSVSYQDVITIMDDRVVLIFSDGLLKATDKYLQHKRKGDSYIRILFEKVKDDVYVLHFMQSKITFNQEKKDVDKGSARLMRDLDVHYGVSMSQQKTIGSGKDMVRGFGVPAVNREVRVPQPLILDKDLIRQANEELDAVTKMLAVNYDDVDYHEQEKSAQSDQQQNKPFSEVIVSNESDNDDVWSLFVSKLSAVQREYLHCLVSVVNSGDKKKILKSIIQKSGQIECIFIDMLNEVAVDCTGDIIIDEDGLIPEYGDKISEILLISENDADN